MLGQVRPLTNQTLYRSDWVGTVVPASERPLVSRSLELGEIIEGEVTNQVLKERVRALCIPVRWKGQTIAVVNREAAPSVRHPGELERTYIEVFNRFARMIASGEFPFRSEEGLSEEAPRVGDGVILLDGVGAGRVLVAQRHLGPAPGGGARQHRGHAARRDRAAGDRGAHRVRHRAARHRGDRAGSRRSPC